LNGSHHVIQSQAKIKYKLKNKITKQSDNLVRLQPFYLHFEPPLVRELSILFLQARGGRNEALKWIVKFVVIQAK